MDQPGGQNGEINWPEIFDKIASEYGYTWRRFLSLTFRQLHHMLDAIDRRQYNNIATQSAMHGVKLPPYRKQEPISEEKLEHAQSETDKLLQNKQAEIKNARQ